CLDEAGMAPLAGPVTAAVVSLSPYSKFRIKKLKDSKKLSQKNREKFYKIITKNKDIKWGIGIASERVIDKVNILEASKIAMGKALKKIKKRPDFLILDGRTKLKMDIPQKSIIKADEKVVSCAMASILAKVTRDRLMVRYHKKYPKYKFNRHKGYPTKLHFKLLKKYGPCKIHRKSFSPVRYCTPK
ncbi:MAG: ribonuclease HII, partial [Patescibacteria group bacterium]